MDPATITLTVQLPTTPIRAFRALTRPSQLRRWFGDVLDYDRSLLVFGAGRQLTFISDGTIGQGQVTVFRPPSVLEYSWNNETLRFDLDSEGEETSLTFTTTIHGAESATIADAARPEWEDALERLRTMFTAPADAGGVE